LSLFVSSWLLDVYVRNVSFFVVFEPAKIVISFVWLRKKEESFEVVGQLGMLNAE
jgi:hypothetical protein